MQRDHKAASGVRADPSRLFHFMFKLFIGIKEIENKLRLLIKKATSVMLLALRSWNTRRIFNQSYDPGFSMTCGYFQLFWTQDVLNIKQKCD